MCHLSQVAAMFVEVGVERHWELNDSMGGQGFTGPGEGQGFH